MSGPTRDDFEKAIDEHWHGRPPASLEDVMALYGVLAVAESGGELYGTPSKLEPFIDDGRLVTVDIDLTEDESKVSEPRVDTLRKEDVSKLAYAHKSSGRGAKYSVTQIGSKNGNDAAGVASTVLRRVRSWTTRDSVVSVTGDDGHPDGWIVDRLADVFEKDSNSLTTLEDQVESLLPSDESVPTAFTVRLRIDASELENSDETGVKWYWPADLDVLTEAMKRYATENAADKNIDSGSSEGEGIGVVSGVDSRVVGTPESPLGIFSVKHPDAQPGLRRDQSWRNYPVTPDVAMLFSKGQDLIEKCVFRNGGVETYSLPYFAGRLTAQKAEALYGAIQSLDRESEYNQDYSAPMARVTYELRESDSEELQQLAEAELRFYTITLPISDDKNVVAEEPAATTYWVSQLADALEKTVHGPTLSPQQGGFQEYENWPLLDFPDDQNVARKSAFNRIVGHEFTNATFAYRGDDEGDDFRRIVDARLVAGVPLNAAMLFDEYVRRYEDASEGGELPPHQVVTQQLIQLETLSRAGLLDGLDVQIEPTDTTMTTDTDLDTSELPAIRENRLESFLDRPLFDDTERRAATLAGVLVGQVSWHQENERSMGRPLDSTTKGDQLSKNSLENALTSALEKAKVYALDSDYDSNRDLLFPETVDRLLETTEDMPTAWNIEKRELQFCYVLGHAHGRRSMPVAFDLFEGTAESNPTTN
ncbi:CRISPR-associated protein, Csh1 family [Halogranum amylolyticum]|uniref:CRISPR-associated protein, Csh1 family n=1 Tax=Halogranum amylolyticum TaxID=660520 RepID=A0A1H8VVP2_9EURY|nr:type I-B CRISPR-associated protein Cas8b/Csh1 [Halogranum amylolyticum]SEP19512.1 CRISPR-associated protein, Csh1 family [Halogranum amylolyticum]